MGFGLFIDSTGLEFQGHTGPKVATDDEEFGLTVLGIRTTSNEISVNCRALSRQRKRHVHS